MYALRKEKPYSYWDHLRSPFETREEFYAFVLHTVKSLRTCRLDDVAQSMLAFFTSRPQYMYGIRRYGTLLAQALHSFPKCSSSIRSSALVRPMNDATAKWDYSETQRTQKGTTK